MQYFYAKCNILRFRGYLDPMYRGVANGFSKKYFHHNYKKNSLKNIGWAREIFWIMSPPYLYYITIHDNNGKYVGPVPLGGFKKSDLLKFHGLRT